MTADETHYCDLMMSLDCLLSNLSEVLKGHAICPGCDLCINAQGMEYTTQMFYGSLYSHAPSASVQRFLEETEDEPFDLLSAPAMPAPADAPRSAAAELPPATQKPYWIA
jgi:hypothetical protein